MADKKICRQHVIARLLTSAVYHDDDGYWQLLTDEKGSFADYFSQMGVRLEVDSEMGMGYLRPLKQAEEEEFASAGHAPLPTQIINLMRPYLPETSDDKALKREVRKVITRVEEISVLRRLPNRSEVIYRVEPIVRARIPLSQLQELLARLKEITKTGASEVCYSDESEKEEP
jgi:hypothetical protein